jgi:hypothetical protein
LKKNTEGSLHIGINALYLLPGKVGGAETYTRNLVKWLAAIDPRKQIFHLHQQGKRRHFRGAGAGNHGGAVPDQGHQPPVRILWEQCVLPFQVRSHKIDVLLSTGLTSPYLLPGEIRAGALRPSAHQSAAEFLIACICSFSRASSTQAPRAPTASSRFQITSRMTS